MDGLILQRVRDRLTCFTEMLQLFQLINGANGVAWVKPLMDGSF